jgi:hypothetical protein
MPGLHCTHPLYSTIMLVCVCVSVSVSVLLAVWLQSKHCAHGCQYGPDACFFSGLMSQMHR